MLSAQRSALLQTYCTARADSTNGSSRIASQVTTHRKMVDSRPGENRMTTAALSHHAEAIEQRVVLLGRWRSARRQTTTWNVQRMNVHPCRDPKELRQTLTEARPSWLLLGQDITDYDLQGAAATTRASRPDVRLGLLGSPDDWRRCESWLRRGCDAYLDVSAPPQHVAHSLTFASHQNVCVVDKVFHQQLRSRHLGPPPSLTRREAEVLSLLARGLGNREISELLFVTLNTIEYHVRHLLGKLGARSRLEAVQVATAFGLL
jgi:DNA-binding NarL/FixJ family response regulator